MAESSLTRGIELSTAGSTVAIDHQPRVILRDQRRVQRCRHMARHRQRPDVPGNVTFQFEVLHPQRAERARYAGTCMIHRDHEGARAGDVQCQERRRLIRRQQGLNRHRHAPANVALVHGLRTLVFQRLNSIFTCMLASASVTTSPMIPTPPAASNERRNCWSARPMSYEPHRQMSSGQARTAECPTTAPDENDPLASQHILTLAHQSTCRLHQFNGIES